jgi:hypothetical protein
MRPASLLVAFLLTGCTVTTEPAPQPVSPQPVPQPQIQPQPQPQPSPPASAVPESYLITPGAALAVQPGVQAEYVITANAAGTYRLVWTGDALSTGLAREFSGTVWTLGHFPDVAPGCADGSCPIESANAVSGVGALAGGGESVTFDAFTTSTIDGIDLTVDVEPIYFDLTIDGVRQPTAILFPSSAGTSDPLTVPFGLAAQ